MNFKKPQTFVKDLPGIEKLKTEYVDALDSFLFEWPMSILPCYRELKHWHADVFECLNVSTFGMDSAERYECDGIHYRFRETPLWGRTLSLDSGAGYTELSYMYCFWNKHPQYHPSNIEYISEDIFFNWYFHRYFNKSAKYFLVTDRLRDYFRYLTMDDDIVFDVGWNSFIYYDSRIRRIIDSHPSIYY